MRVLVSCVALEGHFRPLLPLAHGLQRAGHEVVVATAGSMASRVSAEGLASLPVGLTEPVFRERLRAHLAEAADVPPARRRQVAFAVRFATIQAPAKLDELLHAARAWRPDVVVHESADLAAPLAAAVLDLPSVNHAFGALVPLAALDACTAEVAPLWRRHGLEPAPYTGSFRGPYVDLCPPALRGEEPLSRRIAIRPCEPVLASPSPWLDEVGRPLVYVTLGTVFNELASYEPLLLGIGALDGAASALVTLGRGRDPAALGSLPPRVRVEPYVAQASVLPWCEVVICHGGSGTTLGALAHGRPLLLVPKGADQFDNAARCAEAGVAIVLAPEEVTPEAVRDAVLRLLHEPAYRVAAQRVAAEIASMPTPAEAVVALEAYLGAPRGPAVAPP